MVLTNMNNGVYIMLSIFGWIFVINGLANITCPAHGDCKIICDELDPIKGCYGSVIDASDSISLEIICSSSQNQYYGGCQFSEILCPTSVNSSCHIECNDYYGCFLTKINAESTDNINVKCGDEIGSCLKTTLYANYSYNVDISCFGAGIISSASHASCDNFQIYGQNVFDAINLLCNGDYACKDVGFYVNNAYNVDIFARGAYALSGYIYAQYSNNLHLFCGSEQSQYACYKTYIFTPQYIKYGQPRAHIECQGHGCKDQLYFYSKDGALDLDISLNGCKECDGPTTCIDTWYFYCDYFTFAAFHGDSCESTSCDCNFAVNTINAQTTDNFDECDIFEFDYECESGTDCIIDCINDFVDGCYDKIINANNATSLHVICNGTLSNPLLPYGACELAHIYCGLLDESQCVVDCLNKNSCHDTEITIVNSKNSALNLTCFHIDSCAHTNVYGPNNSDILINCMSYDSCHDISVTANHAKNIIILCDADSGSSYSACNKFEVFALNVTNEIKLICNGDHSCYYIDIYANYSDNIIIDSNGDYAAYYGNIFAQNASNMLISCKSRYGKYGCYQMNFYISTLSTSIECEGYGCYYLSLYSLNGFSDIKNISINGCNHCQSVDHCISNWNMHCGSKYLSSATYYGSTYCWGACYCNDYFLNLANDGWNRNDNFQNLRQCDIANPDVFCRNDEDCIVDCNALNSCGKDVILGSNATSMTVICTDSYSCESVKIYCPESVSSECNVLCNDYQSCANAIVYGGANGTVNVTCNGDYSCQNAAIFVEDVLVSNIDCLGYRSCSSMDIEGDNAKNMNMHCGNSYSCRYVVVHGDNADNIAINCSSQACYYFDLYAINAKTLAVSCIGSYSCSDIDIYANNARNMLIYGIGIGSIDDAEIYAQNCLNAILQCASYKDDSVGCGDATIYIPANNRMNLKCIGYGCDGLTFYSKNGMKDIKNISLNGDDQCASPELCIKNWNLYCGLSYSTNTLFTGTVCVDNECDCNELKLQIEESWVAGNGNFSADRTCEANSDCVIACISSSDCQNSIIHGNQASSLLVVCYNSHSCRKAEIYCPSTTNSSCSVNCIGIGSCYQAVIIGFKNAKLDIEAQSSESFEQGIVLAHEIYQINVNCSGDESCFNTNIYASNAHITNIDCYGYDGYFYSGDACNAMNIFASAAKEQINLRCFDRNSCYGIKLYAQNANNVAIFGGNGQNTLYNAYIYGNNATNFTLTCVGEFPYYYGCSRANIYFPPNERTTLNCYGFGCYNLNSYVSNGMNSLALSNINLNGCGKCYSPNHCISRWIIHCSLYLWSPYDIYTTFSGSDCTTYVHYCNCNQNKDLLTNIFINDTIVPQCLAINTATPTTIPTYMPTIAPTATPTTIPTHMPTFIPPTFSPTGSTLSPTQLPTNAPTARPTVSPSQPTNIPTMHPTMLPSNPTSSPTQSPTAKIIYNESGNGKSIIQLTIDTLQFIVIVVVLCIIILCLIGVVVYCWKVRKENAKRNRMEHLTHIPLTNIVNNISETSGLRTQENLEEIHNDGDGTTETLID